jgi:hypothetical protein
MSVCYDLTPTFPICFWEVLQAEALLSKEEKQESNRKKRAAQQQTAQLKAQVRKLRVKAFEPFLVEVEEGEQDTSMPKWAIRETKQ